MEDGDTEKYHPSSVIQDFVFSSRKSSCIRCISLQVYNKSIYRMTSRLACNKIDNPLVVNRFSVTVMTSIVTLNT